LDISSRKREHRLPASHASQATKGMHLPAATFVDRQMIHLAVTDGEAMPE
jgi:hypothetical protein